MEERRTSNPADEGSNPFGVVEIRQMGEQEITYTVEEEKSETVTVCDGCGVEVEPGENCRTLLSGDVTDYDYDSDFNPGYVNLDWGECKVEGEQLFVRVEGFFETFEDPFYYCFDCWEGVNLSQDEKSLRMSQSYSDRVESRAKEKVRQELKEKSIRDKLSYASREDLFIAVVLIVCTALSVVISVNDVAFTPIPVVTGLLTYVAINDLLQVRV